MRGKLRALAGPLLVLGMLLASLGFLHHELREYHPRDILDSLTAISPVRIGWAVGLTCLSYLVLCGYDLLGVHYLQHRVSLARVVLASFLGYAVGNNFGTLLGGSTVRLRLYTAWGMSAVGIIKLILIVSVTFWVGVFSLASVVFVIAPLQVPEQLKLPFASSAPLGIVLGLVPLGYLGLCALRRGPVKFRRWEFSPPSVRFAVCQLVISAVDLMLLAAVLFVVMPTTPRIDYLHFLAIYLLSLVAGLFSQVPGGLGVFEVVILLLLNPQQPQQVVGALLVYRVIYYLIPLALGLLILAGNEISLHRHHVGKLATVVSYGAAVAAPRVLALSAFLAGVLLLFSGATAGGGEPSATLGLPLPVVEISHLLGSLAGILLTLLAPGLQRRIDRAYWLTTSLLAGGVVCSLLKGWDQTEALVLGLILAAFLPCRRHFHRQGVLWPQRLSPGWFAAFGLVIACTFWLMLLAYKHVDYDHDLWWRFTHDGHASRSLRALAMVVVTTLVFALSRLRRSIPGPRDLPTGWELAAARTIVADCPRATAQLALLGDKYLMFNESRTAFVMYGVEGRGWVSMGDPVGNESDVHALAWEFLERCDQAGAWPVFFHVDQQRTSLYVDMGLTLIKVGDEMRAALSNLDVEHGRPTLRRMDQRMTDAGCVFQLVEPPLDDALMSSLAQVSDAWLAARDGAETGFSRGYFQPDYIRRSPVAIVRQHERPVAFACVWRGADARELAMDVARRRPDAPDDVLRFLLVRLMLWGRDRGYPWFLLGTSPVSRAESPPLGPAWEQLLSCIASHDVRGDEREEHPFAENFDIVWSPKYLALPGGSMLAEIVQDAANLTCRPMDDREGRERDSLM